MNVSRKLRARSLPAAILLAIAVALWNRYAPAPDDSATGGVAGSPPAASAASTSSAARSAADSSDAVLAAAFRDRESDLQVHGRGTVVHILPDDNDGSRHQRFLLETESGQTLLVAHNIDLAPRIAGLRRGDEVAFYGEYEWNDRGGVIHWTHHDPRGRHTGGWLEHAGRRYE